jgi:hypothetical protein
MRLWRSFREPRPKCKDQTIAPRDSQWTITRGIGKNTCASDAKCCWSGSCTSRPAEPSRGFANIFFTRLFPHSCLPAPGWFGFFWWEPNLRNSAAPDAANVLRPAQECGLSGIGFSHGSANTVASRSLQGNLLNSGYCPFSFRTAPMNRCPRPHVYNL